MWFCSIFPSTSAQRAPPIQLDPLFEVGEHRDERYPAKLAIASAGIIWRPLHGMAIWCARQRVLRRGRLG
jgi:hypothetical protein